MSDLGNLEIGNVKKKREDMNKLGGINSGGAVFQTSKKEESNSGSPYHTDRNTSYMSRVDSLANRGPLMDTRIHTQNSLDLNVPKNKEVQTQIDKQKESVPEVKSVEKRGMIRGQSNLRVYRKDVLENGDFTPEAREASRLFFKQVEQWAGSYNDGGSGFYQSMGIKGVLDCLYVDGMSLRSYVKEQYFYKGSGDEAKDRFLLQNYLTLIAAQGKHTITLVRPNIKGNEAQVEYENMEVNLEAASEEQAQNSRELKERGNQVRNSLKNRMAREMNEQTGIAYRKSKGIHMDGFERIEGAKKDLRTPREESSEEYKGFQKYFDAYYGGLQKLGLKPGRDDINLAVSEELRKRCEIALESADAFLKSAKNSAEIQAVKKAKKELETDYELLTKAIITKLKVKNATMSLDELLDSKGVDSGKGNQGNSGIGGPAPAAPEAPAAPAAPAGGE